MKLHIFNPEHDIALAAASDSFTAPHAARKLRADLGFVAALWADDGDVVVVDDVEYALEAVRHVKAYAADVLFVTMNDLRNIGTEQISGCSIHPWGWDAAIRRQLFVANTAFMPCLPSAERLEMIKMMSNRKFAAELLLSSLRRLDSSLVGESRYLSDTETVMRVVAANGQSVLKAPWSGSGRGLRYVDKIMSSHVVGWCKNVIERQGGVMVEPFYDKVLDFGMEFMSDGHGGAVYCGLSLFNTVNGAYAGSVLATEKDKLDMLAYYVDRALLMKVRDCIAMVMGASLDGVYQGPFGVDMMVVASHDSAGFLLHPCVELNLRRTMGHVAMEVSPTPMESRGVMRICYDGRYRLRICNTGENVLNTGLVG